MLCLICTPEAQGPQARGLRVEISGIAQETVLELLYNTFMIKVKGMIVYVTGFEKSRLPRTITNL